ncbi:MAG: SDR family NAD(P)-dependent oxidoreductase [Gemmatimonadota bacterium]|nr:SDR family NAD(P)-dependent oxidoreductase [Gemmatimonadota bacterium]
MADLTGQLIVVTGANSGVGFSLSRMLLDAGAHVIMVCRSRERGEKALEALGGSPRPGRDELEIADISDPGSVRDLATRLQRFDGIAALVNNAGVWRNSLERTAGGFEVTMATNHLGHFLLTRLLMDQLASGGNRIVNVSSEAHRSGKLARAPLRDVMTGAAWKGGLQAYSDSKQANVMFTSELVRRFGDEGLIANSVHPGVLATRIWNKNPGPLTLFMRLFKLIMKSPDVGGRAVLRLLSDPDLADVTNTYFKVEDASPAQPTALDADLARDLWELSERLTE